eukprot:1161554-Pelagomonas_calceolata.AAC.2
MPSAFITALPVDLLGASCLPHTAQHFVVKKLAKETSTLLPWMHAIEKGPPLQRWKFLMRSKEAFVNGCSHPDSSL